MVSGAIWLRSPGFLLVYTTGKEILRLLRFNPASSAQSFYRLPRKLF